MKKDDNKANETFQSDILFDVQLEGLERDSIVDQVGDSDESSQVDWQEDKTASQIVEFVLDVADSSIIDIAEFAAETTLTDGLVNNDTFDELENDALGMENETNSVVIDELAVAQPWDRFLSELREEILSESSPKLRGAFLFLFSRVASIFQQSEEGINALTNLAQVSGFTHRSELLRVVSTFWKETGDGFLQALDSLEQSDSENEEFSALRRSSIVLERILLGGIPDEFRSKLNQRVLPPETLRARFILALDAHRQMDTLEACRSWIRSASLSQNMKHSIRALSAYLLQDSPRYFEEINPLIEKNNRSVLLISQNEARKQGNMEKELDVLKRILGQDVRAGKELQKTDIDSNERLKKDTTARLLRMTILLSKLGDDESAYAVLKDASNLAPANTMVLRSLLRKAYERNDAQGIADAVEKLVLATKNRESRAVMLERYAFFLQENNADNEDVRTVLNRSLSESPQCLPSLISYGQNLIMAGEYPKMFFLRGGVESGNYQSVWRRAELLERTGASVEELVELYREASLGNPSNPHFFFSYERILSRAGEWGSLKALYDDAISEGPLTTTLKEGRFDVQFYRLALSIYLANEVSASLWGELDEYLSTHADDPAVWEILREEVDSDPGRALGRLEILKQNLKDAKASVSLRTLIWNVHIVGSRLQAGNQLGKVFEALLRSNSFYVSRIAAKGMVENDQLEKLAEMTISEKRGLFWLSSEEKGEQRRLVAAELLASTGQHQQAIDELRKCVENAENPQLRSEIGERALALALQNNHWEGVLSFLPNIEEDVCALIRHLSVSIESSKTFLQEISFERTPTRDTTTILLSELELAYRVKNWKNALSILTRCLRTLAAGTIDFRSFILQQACLIAEWESPEESSAFLDDLWSLHNTKRNPPIFLVSAQIRNSARVGDEEGLSKWLEIAKDVFAPSLAEALAEEAILATEISTPLEAAQWYQSRFQDVYDSVKPYYKFMIATLRWGWEENAKRDVQTLADAVAYGDPTDGVGDFLLAIGYRDAGMMQSFEKHLLQVKERHCVPLQEWAETRLFFHRAITKQNIEEGIEDLKESPLRVAPWASILKELFLRSIKHESASSVLQSRAKVATGGRSIRLELAEIQQDKTAIEELADDGLISAQVSRFLLLESDSELDVDAYFESVKEKLVSQADDALGAFTKYFQNVGPHFLGSPWCPIFLWRRYSSDQKLSSEDLASMRFYLDRVDDDLLPFVQLFFAQQYELNGDRKEAAKLSPPVGGKNLVDAANDLFRYFLSPRNRQSAKTESEFWNARAQTLGDSLAEEAQYEIGRALAQAGLEDEAILCFEKSLGFNARFLPAQVAAGRTLIHTQNWTGLAKLWEQELLVIEDENLIASLSFRLGFLHLRRLEGDDSTRRAVEFFERVLRVQENHLPTIEALIEIGYQHRDFEMVVRYTTLLERFEETISLRCDRQVELAMMYELELQDHKQALSAYSQVLEQEPKRSDALFGLLRTDHSGEASVQALVRRLEFFGLPFDVEDVESYLISISRTSESAKRVLKQRFPLSIPNLLARVVEAFENGEIASDEIGVLGRMRSSELELFTEVSTRMLQPHYMYSNESISLDPQHEGKLVALMHSAEQSSGPSAQRDEIYLSTLGELAVARARRSKDAVVRVSEMTWMVCTLWLRGERKEAQFAIEKLLTQFTDFGPAIKLAKLFAEQNEDWESAAKWYSKEIEKSGSVELTAHNRVRLSQIQSEHLRDASSALEQLEQLLVQNPSHGEAFKDLKAILLRQGEYAKLVEHSKTYVNAIHDKEEKKSCFNEMAMISHQHLKDVDAAISFYQSSVELDPDQPRELRILAEALERKGEISEAIVRYTAAAKLSDTKLKARIWNHVGELNETNLKQDREALHAYKNAMNADPASPELFEKIARCSEKVGEFDDAIQMTRKILSTKVNETRKLNARIGLARLGKKSGDSPKTFLKNIREVLLFHPDHQPSIEVARREIANTPGLEEEHFFEEIIQAMLRRDPKQGLKAAFNISKQLGQSDKAFCLASIADALEVNSPELGEFLETRKSDRRWPQKSIPRELANTLLPTEISPQVLEFLRLVREGVYVGLFKNPEIEKMKAKHKVKNSAQLTLNLAERWPGVFNLPTSNLFVGDSVPSYSVIPDGAKVKIVINSRWEKEHNPEKLLFPLGKELAAHSMGIAPWNEFDLDSQLSLLIAIIAKYVVEWNHVSRKHLPKNLDFMKTSKWLGKQDRRIAAYAIGVSARHNAESLRAQLQTLADALERFSGAVIDDPGRLVRANLLKQKTSVFPGDFFLSPEIQALRKELGISVNR